MPRQPKVARDQMVGFRKFKKCDDDAADVCSKIRLHLNDVSERLAKPLYAVFIEFSRNLLFVEEMMVDRADTAARPLADIRHIGVEVTLFDKQFQ